MVERQLPKLNVAGSIPVSRSIINDIRAQIEKVGAVLTHEHYEEASVPVGSICITLS